MQLLVSQRGKSLSLSQHFGSYDSDRDGMLTEGEVVRALAALGMPHSLTSRLVPQLSMILDYSQSRASKRLVPWLDLVLLVMQVPRPLVDLQALSALSSLCSWRCRRQRVSWTTFCRKLRLDADLQGPPQPLVEDGPAPGTEATAFLCAECGMSRDSARGVVQLVSVMGSDFFKHVVPWRLRTLEEDGAAILWFFTTAKTYRRELRQGLLDLGLELSDLFTVSPHAFARALTPPSSLPRPWHAPSPPRRRGPLSAAGYQGPNRCRCP
jgi:hypothetical protein